MRSKWIQYRYRILFSILIILGLGFIRAFENSLFYDPFLNYFKADFNSLPYPEVNTFRLFCGLFFRYILNSILSLALIYTLFRDVEILKFTSFLFVFFLVLLFGLFFIIFEYFPDGSWLLFYVRRFIIQPIFVLIFIPAFYYQQQYFKK
ncbi:exosortase F-associated protein [Flavobacterium cutihirudinis]|uniref:Exosortase F-associated protein n=1 Tax=Flavobacterium cutihirudinis TaxID=1265740 RepID=A0A3D9FX53_9FLAO|nr:exosortase F system-associated protein [Flavobacterium cutihirudinis]RED25334.1 exosortase F-associated protein [Flavobacterium cutihirudinis]